MGDKKKEEVKVMEAQRVNIDVAKMFKARNVRAATDQRVMEGGLGLGSLDTDGKTPVMPPDPNEAARALLAKHQQRPGPEGPVDPNMPAYTVPRGSRGIRGTTRG